MLATILEQLGRAEEAKTETAETLRLDSTFRGGRNQWPRSSPRLTIRISSMGGVEPASIAVIVGLPLGEAPEVASSSLFGASQFACVLVVLAARWKIDSRVPQLTLNLSSQFLSSLRHNVPKKSGILRND